MQKVAQNWLVLTIGGSPFWLGLDAFVGELPILLLTLVGGVIADRHDRRWLLIGSQLVQAACAFVLAALVFGGAAHVPIYAVLALSFCTGVAQAFGGPAYQSLLPALVPREDLPNAVALNSLQFNLSRILGPLVASVTLAAAGLTICFLLNGLSFFIVVAALLLLRLDRTVPNVRRSIADEMRTGLSYVKHRPALLELTVLGFLMTFLAFPLQTLLPVMAKDVFRQGIDGYSHLMICSGTGAVLGAGVVAWRGRAPHMGRHALVLGGLVGLLADRVRDGADAGGRLSPAARDERGADHRHVDRDFAGPARGAGRDARARHEHLHGRLPRRAAARRPGGRLAGQRDVGADGAGRLRRRPRRRCRPASWSSVAASARCRGDAG